MKKLTLEQQKAVDTLQDEMSEFIEAISLKLGPDSKIEYTDIQTIYFLTKIAKIENDIKLLKDFKFNSTTVN